MTETALASPAAAHPYLSGNYAPVSAELTVDAPLAMEGALPPALEGTLVRSGPNPVLVGDPGRYRWCDGDGMVHAVDLAGGRATAYRNRWVRTRRLASATGTPSPRGPREPVDGPANGHVIAHAGKLLALSETGFPHRLTLDLATVAVEDFDATLASPVAAHPHRDPETGGLALFGVDPFGPPYLRYHELDADGTVVHSTEVEIPWATAQHDMAVTARRVVFLDLPVALGRPGPGGLPAGRWMPELGARLGVLDRGAPGNDVRWVEIDPCAVFHVANAADDGTGVVLDVCRYDRGLDGEPGTFACSTTPVFERWALDPVSRRLTRTPLDERALEFPRVDEALAGRPQRYTTLVHYERGAEVDLPVGLVRYDHRRDEAQAWHPGPDRYVSEAVFVRAPDGRADDEGWLLTVVYDRASDRSDLVVLDGTRLGGRPEAVVHLPARVPFGFHGSWIPAGSVPSPRLG